ncbi:hypothetical protein GWI33_012734, partial [Rhynchophorus ferrugineus]
MESISEIVTSRRRQSNGVASSGAEDLSWSSKEEESAIKIRYLPSHDTEDEHLKLRGLCEISSHYGWSSSRLYE